MERILNDKTNEDIVRKLCEDYIKSNKISKDEYMKYEVKRGLRHESGAGVMAGLTRICNVHGYAIEDGERVPKEGRLTYRGINILDIIEGCTREKRYSFEETVWLLLFGFLPNKDEYDTISQLMRDNRELPGYFVEDVIMKNPSKDIMNKVARGVLTLYSYDDKAEDLSIENNMRQSISLIAKIPSIMAYAYQVKRRHFEKQSMFLHPFEKEHYTAQAILSSVREDRGFTEEEAKLLDLCLTLHAEHGGGNNSTFTSRVLSSSETDIYATISAAIGSLKGLRHGGANYKVYSMMEDIKQNVKDWTNDDEIEDYLEKIIRKEVGDKSGLIYGVGHAVYTVSDPRAIILKTKARELARTNGYEEEFSLFERVEAMAPEAFLRAKKSDKVISANVDFYSGLVYRMLGIPQDLFTPLFATARTAGWCAHRIEEMLTGGRIIRPAYRALPNPKPYLGINER